MVAFTDAIITHFMFPEIFLLAGNNNADKF